MGTGFSGFFACKKSTKPRTQLHIYNIYKEIEKQKEKLYNFTYNNKGGSLKWIV